MRYLFQMLQNCTFFHFTINFWNIVGLQFASRLLIRGSLKAIDAFYWRSHRCSIKKDDQFMTIHNRYIIVKNFSAVYVGIQ